MRFSGRSPSKALKLLLLSWAAYTQLALGTDYSIQKIKQDQSHSAHINPKFDFLSSLYDDGLNPAEKAGLLVSLVGDYTLEKSLSADFNFGLIAESGNSQVVYNNDYLPKQSFFLTEAALNFHPIDDRFIFRIGALSQGRIENPLLFSEGVSFPGLQENLKIGISSNSTFELTAEQTVPSANLTSPMPMQEQKMPTFLSTGAVFTLTEPKSAGISFRSHFKYFSFSQLSNGVAQNSRFRGNTVSGLGPQGAAFIYDYSGNEAAAQIAYHFNSSLQIFVFGLGISNSSAPIGQNQGHSFGFGTRARLSESLQSTTRFQSFAIESDAAPAYYNEKSYGHTNYQGWSIEQELLDSKSNISASLRYSHASVLNANPYQSDFSLISLQVGKSYDLF